MSDTYEERNLRAALERVTRERNEALAVLNDARQEQAWEALQVRRFGERLRGLEADGHSIDLACCYSRDYVSPGLHDSRCRYAALLRDMLGAEETQRQVDAAHVAAIEHTIRIETTVPGYTTRITGIDWDAQLSPEDSHVGRSFAEPTPSREDVDE